jgi:hypothetical protein
MGGGWRLHCTEDPSGEPQPISGVFGRGGLLQVGDCILRPYRRGGLLRHFNKGTYCSPRRFRREYEVHAALWTAGFPTVEPIGYAYRRRSLGFEGAFLTRKTEGLPWPQTWGDGGTYAAPVANLIRLLSAWGLWAPDLNATNFLLAPDGRGIALDWDKARWTARPSLLEDYLERLERSLLKLNAPPSIIGELRAHLRTAR